MKGTTAKNRIDLAARIAEAGRDRVLMRLRFLHSAFFHLSVEPVEESGSFMTDAFRIVYDPDYLITEFSKDSFAAQEMWLHSVLHCLFRHMFVHSKVIRRYWDLACDIAVAALIRDLVKDGLDQVTVAQLRRLENELGPLTAEKIYRYLIDSGMTESVLKELEEVFCIDDHSLWYQPAVKKEGGKKSQGEERKGQGKETQTDNREYVSDEIAEENDSLVDDPNELTHNTTAGESSRKIDGQADGTPVQTASEERNENAESIWKEISERTRTELETYSRMMSDQEGALLQALALDGDQKADYEDFLRKFMSRCEIMDTSPDEFDYIYYTYGLKMYGDMPLIEPLEYTEDKRIRDLVIVIDTSGSVKGEQVKGFLRKTCNIMQQERAFDRRFKLHLIQCDKSIKEDKVLTSREEFDDYTDSLILKGFGGTDFRPAFDYVSQLRQEGAFQSLKGLLYFTDGEGRFPETATDYLTAFVFTDRKDALRSEVPGWAARIVIDTDDFGTEKGTIL